MGSARADLDAEESVVSCLRNGPIFEGIFSQVGEPEAVQRLVERGHVLRFYEGVGGFLGLAKVRLA